MIAAAVLAAGADLAVDLESAIRRETVQGDLKGAAEAYRKIASQAASSKNREVAARALLRLALVYRKQGDAQARQTLERVVKDYSDQQQVVAEARGELARMGNGKPVLAAKLLWNRGGVSSVSRDGRLVTFEDFPPGTANIRDLATGDTRVLPYGFDASAYLFDRVGSRLSPDGRWVAFSGPESPLPADVWGRMVLGIMHPDGTGKVTLYRSEAWPGDVSPYGWTPDSKQVLCRVARPPRGSVPDLVLISVASGEVRTVRRTSPDGAGDPAVSPDNRWIAYSVKGRVQVVSIDGASDT